MASVPDDCSRTYEVLRPLGTGGFGTVFLAKHRQLGREVALKVLNHEMVLDQEQRQRFLDEARVTAQLSDPHVVKVLDHGVAEVPWIAYEYLPGRTVKDMLAAGPIQWRDALQIASQVAAALEAAHDAGVIHRDIKAENVLEASPGHFKVADFGIARWAGSQVKTASGFVMGTPTHMAPEMWKGAPAGQRSDLYALGVLLYELLVGKLPFDGDNISQILNAHLEQPPATPGRLQPDVPPAVSELVKKALAKEPEDRFAVAGQLRTALDRLQDARPAGPGSRAGGSRAGGSRAAAGLPANARPVSRAERSSGITRAVSAVESAPERRWWPAVAGGALLAVGVLAFALAPRPKPVASASPVASPSAVASVPASLDPVRVVDDLRLVARVACGAFAVAIDDDSNLMAVGVRPVKNVPTVLPIVEEGVERMARGLLEARSLEPGPVWGVLAVVAMEALRPVSLLLPEQRPTAMLENLRKIAMVTRATSGDPFRGAFDSVLRARIDALIKPDLDGARNTGDKLAWAAKQLEMVDPARWGRFENLRPYVLLRLTHLEIEARQSAYRHLGALDTASPELMRARQRGVAFARALVDAKAASADDLELLVDFYMQMGRLVGTAADAAERARLIGLADAMWRLFETAPLKTAARMRVARMRESLQSRR